MSRAAVDRRREVSVLGDTDLFFFYLRGGKLEVQAEKVIIAAQTGKMMIRTSSEVYDDAITALRAEGTALSIAKEFVGDMKSIPHTAFPMSAEVAEDALNLYTLYGGRRRLSYFDSFHVATARRYDMTILTSDKFILNNIADFGIKAKDLAEWGQERDSQA